MATARANSSNNYENINDLGILGEGGRVDRIFINFSLKFIDLSFRFIDFSLSFNELL